MEQEYHPNDHISHIDRILYTQEFVYKRQASLIWKGAIMHQRLYWEIKHVHVSMSHHLPQ